MKTDTLNRRLRFDKPNPQVRRLVLSEADYMIFEAISRHGPLPTNYLFEFTKHIRKDYSHLQNRLTEFYNGDDNGPYLVRPPQQFAGFEARYQHIVYDLAPRAKNAITDRGTVSKSSPRRTDPFLHQLMGACVGASLELGAKAKGIRYISRGEILTHPRVGEARNAKNPMAMPLHGFGEKGILIPDDLFGFEYPDEGYRFFAVEIDRNTESIERTNFTYNTIGKKVAGYVRAIDERTFKHWWGIPNLSVLMVTTNATHAGNMIDHIKNKGERLDRFAITVEPSFTSNWHVPKALLSHLLDEPWLTPTGNREIAKA